MTETIIPGTYIDVYAEGLISAGSVATGVVGIVGTSSAGAVLEPVTLGLPDEARARFGPPGDPRDPEEDQPLTLVRAVELCYANGASTVVAVRVAAATARAANLSLLDVNGATVAILTANSPGTWGNGLRVTVAPSAEDCLIERENVPAPFIGVRYSPVVSPARTRVRATRGATGRSDGFVVVYRRLQSDERLTPTAAGRFMLSAKPVQPGVPAARVTVKPATGPTVSYVGDSIEYDPAGAPPAGKVSINTGTGELVFAAAAVPGPADIVTVTYGVGHADPVPGEVLLTTWNGTLDFAPGEGPDQMAGDRLEATYLVDRSSCVEVNIAAGGSPEHYVAPDATVLADRVNQSSALVTAVPDEVHGRGRPAPAQASLGTGSNQRGSDGSAPTRDDYAAGLQALANRTVNIVVLAGQHATEFGDVLGAHLALTESSEHERMGVIGAAGDSVDEICAHGVANGRIVVAAPGIRYPDGLVLPAGYTAAAVAGLMSSFSVQTSLTNKTINVPGPDRDVNRGEQAQLIRASVLAVVRKGGVPRVLRGLTSEGLGMPFSAIPTRRIVDYARYGVRSAADPYIGRLNNSRVRDAMKATLDAFLTGMVVDEALTAYDLSVFADRAQEIQGEVSVVMTLQPMFSVEVVRVKMYLR